MSSPLISPEILARLKPLRLRTRLTTAGQGIGQHASRSRGAGLEFAQYRAYEPGDEPRRVDWKLYARSDRFFVREAERDSPLTAWVLVDASASMAQADALTPQRSRLAAARTIAACIAELALRQNDGFGLIGVTGKGVSRVPAGIGTRHRDRVVFELQRLEATGLWPAENALRPVWEAIGPSSLVVVISDGFDDRVLELAERLAAAQREVLFVRVLTVEERDFPFEGGPLFRDPETGEQRRIDATRARQEFLARFGESRAALLRRLAAAGIRGEEIVLDEPLDQPLQRFFGPRAGA